MYIEIGITLYYALNINTISFNCKCFITESALILIVNIYVARVCPVIKIIHSFYMHASTKYVLMNMG